MRVLIFQPQPFIALAIAVWVLWRVVTWRRIGGDPVRELVVAALFGWLLVVFYFTFFPMTIIFYSWFGRFNLVPFASILQLIRETSAGLASYNIFGNLLLLAPLGMLLPLLFKKLQRPWPLIWRVSAISALIEASQFITRARAVDIDDVILNTLGAAIGFGLYALVRSPMRRNTRGAALLGRLGTQPAREPLLLAAVPLGGTAAFAIPYVLFSLVGATLGSQGIVAHATDSMPGSEVVGRFDVNEYVMLILESGDTPAEVGMWMYKNVLPGRYTWLSGGEYKAFTGSGYQSTITTYNVEAGEIPTYYVWGPNEVGATTVVIEGKNVHKELPLGDGRYFATGFYYQPDSSSGYLETLDFRFLDETGEDVTAQFSALDG